MIRYPFALDWKGAATAATLTLSAVIAGACSFGTSPDNVPTSAVIDIQGSTPNPLELIVSTDFYEQLNTSTGERKPVLVTSDTVLITPPYHDTVDIAALGSVYVELYQPEVATASVHMMVDLDNGQHYEQNATLADKAQLIYYFVFTDYSFR